MGPVRQGYKFYSPKIRRAKLRGHGRASACASFLLLLAGVRLLKYSTEQTGKYAAEWMLVGAFVSVFSAAGILWSLKLYGSARDADSKGKAFRGTPQTAGADSDNTDTR